MKHLKFTGYNKCEIAYTLWDEVENPKAIVQISHGMAEYIDRYDDFAQYLNSKGYIVCGDDHRGHGRTVEKESLGITDGTAFLDTVEDLNILSKLMKEQYNLPLFLLGHSYGSFLSQGYIQKFSDDICGCILSGSAYMGTPLVGMGRFIAKLQHAFICECKPAKLLNQLSFGGYDKPFKAENQPFAWLSRDVELVKKYVADDYCGYVMSIGFFYAFFQGLKAICDQQALKNIRKDLPILICSGDRDPVGNNGVLVKKLFEVYKTVGISDVDIKLYPEGRHEILNETNKAEVYEKMLSFFEDNLPKNV